MKSCVVFTAIALLAGTTVHTLARPDKGTGGPGDRSDRQNAGGGSRDRPTGSHRDAPARNASPSASGKSTNSTPGGGAARNPTNNGPRSTTAGQTGRNPNCVDLLLGGSKSVSSTGRNATGTPGTKAGGTQTTASNSPSNGPWNPANFSLIGRPISLPGAPPNSHSPGLRGPSFGLMPGLPGAPSSYGSTAARGRNGETALGAFALGMVGQNSPLACANNAGRATRSCIGFAAAVGGCLAQVEAGRDPVACVTQAAAGFNCASNFAAAMSACSRNRR